MTVERKIKAKKKNARKPSARRASWKSKPPRLLEQGEREEREDHDVAEEVNPPRPE